MNTKNLESLVGLEAYKSKTDGVCGIIKQIPDDFIVEEITPEPEKKVMKIDEFNEFDKNSPKGEFTRCTMQKYNWDTMRAVKEISKRLHTSHNRIGFAGMKDKYALTSQRISIYNTPIERLKEVKIKDIILGNFEYSDDKIDLGDLWGNRFTIAIRAIDDLNFDEIRDRIKA
ncbi:MAG: hypothetical protein CVT90_02905, partial [Candidatus Altiarchaeales archaeon HGW-Altiarchaeales-3]